jgi:hypothetical protein
LPQLFTLGGSFPPAHVQFRFSADDDFSGCLAFAGSVGDSAARHLLVTDAGSDAVHVIDVRARRCVGYLAAPGSLTGPRGVAARGTMAAVSTWTHAHLGDHVVCLFERTGSVGWRRVRVVAGGFGYPGGVDGQLDRPCGLRLTADGTGLAIVDSGNKRVSLFRVQDGSFAQHVVSGILGPMHDVEECEGGWLVTSTFIEHMSGGRGVGRVMLDSARTISYPTALAIVPGLGLVAREYGTLGRLRFFATPDTLAIASMSAHRLGWMVGVARGILARDLFHGGASGAWAQL